MGTPQKPSVRLAKKTLPKQLFRAISHIFEQNISGCVLAGGTALAGFYAEHRRSDDIDLFTIDLTHHRSAVLATKSLTTIGVDLTVENETAQYFEGVGKLSNHHFKITVVLDSNLFRVGQEVQLENNIRVVNLETLFKMKAATLVSRCGEKDLYDLIWLFGHFPERTFADLIALGNEIDGGLNGEALLSSIAGAILRKDACDFALDESISATEIFQQIGDFKKQLIKGIIAHLENDPPLPLGSLLKKLERISKS